MSYSRLMPPDQTKPVSFRISVDSWKVHSAIAEAKSIPLAQQLRRAVEENTMILGRIEELTERLQELLERMEDASSPEAMLLELLILTRAKSSPQDVDMARGEVRRQNLKPWSGRD